MLFQKNDVTRSASAHDDSRQQKLKSVNCAKTETQQLARESRSTEEVDAAAEADSAFAINGTTVAVIRLIQHGSAPSVLCLVAAAQRS
jgi:hypothetical protein